jgi:hypothetical protein
MSVKRITADTGIEKYVRRFWVVTGRPENKNLLVASGCFDMILKSFMSKNTHL